MCSSDLADGNAPAIGSIGWMDLTVENAEQVRDFYQAIAGWQPTPLDMGGYSDFVMSDASGKPVGGVCHARGTNAGLPPVWLLYIVVESLEQSIARCKELGGELLVGPKTAGEGQYCIVRDPAGAAVAFYEFKKPLES